MGTAARDRALLALPSPLSASPSGAPEAARASPCWWPLASPAASSRTRSSDTGTRASLSAPTSPVPALEGRHHVKLGEARQAPRPVLAALARSPATRDRTAR